MLLALRQRALILHVAIFYFRMSTRIKALDYITQEFNHQGFIPFVQERNHRGQLIKQTKTFEPLEATEEPIPQ
jgi:hypothetical protein